MDQLPVHCNVLWPSREGALSAPRGDIHLTYLPDCGHIYNSAFDPELMTYTEAYENSLHFSPRFQEYATNLAERLIATYDLRGKDIVEIGSGQGDFLQMLCQMGGNRGVGFDPSYAAEEGVGDTAVSFVQAYYSEEFADYPADFICCRHVLEHIHEPVPFLKAVHRAINGRMDTVVFFEVPNALWTVRQLGIWDIIYEHCSYYSPVSLTHLFTQAGFAVLAVNETFGGQFLTIEARLAAAAAVSPPASTADLADLSADVARFADNYRQKVAHWQGVLQDLAGNGRRVVVWGSGSKGVMFMNTFDQAGLIRYAVDINPRKQGMFVAGSGQEIISPEFLRVYQPDVVIIMNRNYEDEIAGQLAQLGLVTDILVA
ncbi:MAG: methyltransferase domain-containing protein [Chloroflexi bacterium]|nr:methyltransferase domain-containing protein [Chloroflexota bacterium]